MIVILDTCVILDVLLDREPFVYDGRRILEYSIDDKITAFITAKSVTDIFYLFKKNTHSSAAAIKNIKDLIEMVRILDTTAEDIFMALEKDPKDFEDAVMEATAIRNKMDAIITRNEKDFLGEGVRIINPADFTLAEA